MFQRLRKVKICPHNLNDYEKRRDSARDFYEIPRYPVIKNVLHRYTIEESILTLSGILFGMDGYSGNMLAKDMLKYLVLIDPGIFNFLNFYSWIDRVYSI